VNDQRNIPERFLNSTADGTTIKAITPPGSVVSKKIQKQFERPAMLPAAARSFTSPAPGTRQSEFVFFFFDGALSAHDYNHNQDYRQNAGD
jgi:hypothetical protein